MFCIKCGSTLGQGNKFCAKCGAEVNSAESNASKPYTGWVWTSPVRNSSPDQTPDTDWPNDRCVRLFPDDTDDTHTVPSPSNTVPTEDTSPSDLTKDLKKSDRRLLARTVSSLKTGRGFCIFGLVLFGLLVICMVEAFLIAEALVFAVLTGFFIWRTSKLTKAIRIRKVLDERIEAAKGENKFN